MTMWVIEVSLVVLLVYSSIPGAHNKDTPPELRNKVIYCGACLALASEIEWYVGIIDGKKMVDVGGFRLDPKGNIKTKEVPLKTSEIHLTDVFDYICRHMHTYAENVDADGNVNYIPTEARDGTKSSQTHIRVSADIGHSLEFACDTLVDEQEEFITDLLRAGNLEFGEELCVSQTNYCSLAQVAFSRSERKALYREGNDVNETPAGKDETLRKYVGKDEKQFNPEDFTEEDLRKYLEINKEKVRYAGQRTTPPPPTDHEWEYGIPPPPTARDEL